jgi:hypothetical protein
MINSSPCALVSIGMFLSAQKCERPGSNQETIQSKPDLKLANRWK